MTNNYYKKHKKDSEKKHAKKYQNLSEEEKTKIEKRPKKDVKILLK